LVAALRQGIICLLNKPYHLFNKNVITQAFCAMHIKSVLPEKPGKCRKNQIAPVKYMVGCIRNPMHTTYKMVRPFHPAVKNPL